jgi:hypothetical protein
MLQKRRRGKSDTTQDTKYNDKENAIPLTDAPLGEEQREHRRLAAFNTAAFI